MHPIKMFFRDNGLSILMFGLFVVFTIGLSLTGYTQNNQVLESHGQPTETYWEYITSGEFVEAVFENWESEFLQMAALVIATVFLRQKGSHDSKKLRGKGAVDTSSRYSIIGASSWSGRRKALKEVLYSNSLGLALVALFLLSFVLHAAGGVAAYNNEQSQHNEIPLSTVEYIRSAQFWFESLQNWQSEFLAVGTLLVLSIYLRQRGSPESKSLGESDKKTGA